MGDVDADVMGSDVMACAGVLYNFIGMEMEMQMEWIRTRCSDGVE